MTDDSASHDDPAQHVYKLASSTNDPEIAAHRFEQKVNNRGARVRLTAGRI